MRSNSTLELILAMVLFLCLAGCRRGERENKLMPEKTPQQQAQSALEAQNSKTYTAISTGDEFPQRIREVLMREVVRAAPDWPATKVDRLTDMVRNYLVALNTGDFETYWRFRAPTGRCFVAPQAFATLRKDILRRQAHIGTEYISAEKLETTKDPKELLFLMWKLLVSVPEERYMLRYIDSNTCVREVALDDVHIDLIPLDTGELDLASRKVSVVLQVRNRGVFTQPAMFQPLPHFSSAFQQEAGGFSVVSVTLHIKLNTGLTLPVFIVAYWNAIEECFLPAVHGSQSGQRPFCIPF